ncbi:hypothetical protein K1719_002621 [Acacia pycnantha]|nr:hypothetical protein K1719_002621 [Acacia pycnantha]
MKPLSPQLLLLLLLISTFRLLPQSSATTVTTTAPAPADFIRSVCNNTHAYADLCYSSFSPYANVIKQNPAPLVHVAVAVSHSMVYCVATDVTRLARKSKGKSSGAFADCISTLGDATDQTSDSLGQLQQIAAGKGGDFNTAMDSVLTEMSAVLTNEDTCLDEFQEEPEGPVKKEVVDLVTEAKKFTSIALAFVNHYAKNGSP